MKEKWKSEFQQSSIVERLMNPDSYISLAPYKHKTQMITVINCFQAAVFIDNCTYNKVYYLRQVSVIIQTLVIVHGASRSFPQVQFIMEDYITDHIRPSSASGPGRATAASWKIKNAHRLFQFSHPSLNMSQLVNYWCWRGWGYWMGVCLGVSWSLISSLQSPSWCHRRCSTSAPALT